MTNTALLTTIAENIRQAQQEKAERKVLYTDPQSDGKHEFLFFIKPEITLNDKNIQLEKILNMIFQKLEAFRVGIKNVLLLPAPYLEAYAIIAEHYGVINAIARNAKKGLNSNASQHFEEVFGIALEKAEVYGGLEFMAKFNALTPLSLDYLWQNSPVVKLGGGAYAQSLKIDGQPVFLVNGFHPRQLEHFIMPGRSIVAFTLTGDLDWEAARNRLIGKTNPNDAAEGSIRRTLLDHSGDYGLSVVNASWNGVHLSAGPVEGLVELVRYNSDFSTGEKLSINEFRFGRALNEQFAPEIINRILSNEEVMHKGETISIFDLTEEKNADRAIDLLTEVYAGVD